MDLLKKIGGAWGAFLPPGLSSLLQDTGTSAVLLLIVVVLGVMLWQSVIKTLIDHISIWLKENSRNKLLFLYGLPVLGCLITASIYSAAVMAVVALVALLLHRAGRLRWKIRWLILPQAVLLITALLLESRLREQENRATNELLQVYVVLPFEEGEDLQESVKLSEDLRDTVEEVFGDLVKVRVAPGRYSEVKDLADWKRMKIVAKRLKEEQGLEPDVVLVNGLGLYDSDPQAPRCVRLRPAGLMTVTIQPMTCQVKTCTPTADLHALPGVEVIQKTGCRAHIRHLVLRASLDILEEVTESEQFELEQADEEHVRRKILDRYLRLVSSDPRAPSGAVQMARSARVSKTIDPGALRKIIESYPEDETPAVKAAVARGERTSSAAVVVTSEVPEPVQALGSGPTEGTL